jgi:hypothetical protein
MSRRFIVEPRGLAPWWLKLLVPVASVVGALVLGALFLASTGNDWIEVYAKMADTAFGSSRGFSETLVSAAPLILTGVAAAIAFKMLVWNIGGEGQLIMGGVFAAGVGIWLSSSTPIVIAIPAVIAAGALGGAAWASLSALPKVYLGTNEIITTLMLNFIALNLMNYLVLGSFRWSGGGDSGGGHPREDGSPITRPRPWFRWDHRRGAGTSESARRHPGRDPPRSSQQLGARAPIDRRADRDRDTPPGRDLAVRSGGRIPHRQSDQAPGTS